VVFGVQFLDKEGRTPLILACTRGDLFEMVLMLLNLGANMKAYRPGRLSVMIFS
jgi:ankyrin repeat protein